MDSQGRAETALRLREHWLAEEAPDPNVDYIAFADGTLMVMELCPLEPVARYSRPAGYRWSELLQATKWTPSSWLCCDERASHTHGGYRALAGESSWGSIGWVALAREGAEGSLEWVATSFGSNPFSKVELNETTLTAASTAGYIWEFPRGAPQKVRITADPDYP
ncbi:hypothetical protein [Glycomyces salinus]|uniref:hypothetical protein n=1 Tax=Glycomyces salinus TaxID=980294 RepID=UPI0018EB1BEF|nr:hypothetical protein [Glycomyces salinus]